MLAFLSCLIVGSSAFLSCLIVGSSTFLSCLIVGSSAFLSWLIVGSSAFLSCLIVGSSAFLSCLIVGSSAWFQASPSFRHFHYRKAGRAWYLSSCEHDVIKKWQKFAKLTGCVSCIFKTTTCSMLGVYNSLLPLARYVW